MPEMKSKLVFYKWSLFNSKFELGYLGISASLQIFEIVETTGSPFHTFDIVIGSVFEMFGFPCFVLFIAMI